MISIFLLRARARDKWLSTVSANWPITIDLVSVSRSLAIPVRNEPPVSKTVKSTARNGGNIYIGVGGWTFEPWVTRIAAPIRMVVPISALIRISSVRSICCVSAR